MELIYATKKLEEQCTLIKAANKLFGGNTDLKVSLLARINALKNAETLKDIVAQPAFHFHDLKNKNGKNYKGYFAIDVKSRKEPWRIIMQPLNADKEPYVPCNIDEIAGSVRIVEITEVSNHYE